MEVHLANQSRDRINGLTTGPKVRCSSFAPRWRSTSKKSNFAIHRTPRGVNGSWIRAATMMWTARREGGREGACGDWAGAAFWTEFTRRGQPSGNCSVPQYKRRLERRGENGESG